MLSKISIAVCLSAAIATLGLILPGAYCRLTSAEEIFHVIIIVGPYLFLALLAWRSQSDQRTSRTILILSLLLAFGGLWIFAAETSDYRAEVAAFIARDTGRGAEYLQARFQRTALFIVPAVQWFVLLMAAGALLLQAGLVSVSPERQDRDSA